MPKASSPRKSNAVTILQASVKEPRGVVITQSTEERALEVTHEQHFRMVQKKKSGGSLPPESSSNRGGTPRGAARGISRLLSRGGGASGTKNRSVVAPDNASVNDGSILSNGNETVKVSNKSEMKPSEKKDKKRWNKMKRIMIEIGAKSKSAADDNTVVSKSSNAKGGSRRQRALTEDSSSNAPHTAQERQRTRSNLNRVRSEQNNATSQQQHKSSSAAAREEQEKQDDSIRGRFYGVDIFHLGGGQFAVPEKRAAAVKSNTPPWEAPLPCTFTGKSTHWSQSQIVSEMLWSAGGRDPPEIILEGTIPGPDGRWSVRIEEAPQEKAKKKGDLKKIKFGQWWNFESPPPPPMERSGSFDTSDDDGSPVIPSHKLRGLLWGTDPAPADVMDLAVPNSSTSAGDDKGASERDEDPMITLAARCSIPIDIDDDSFLISTRDHIQAMHDIAGLALSKGQFHVAFRMFNALLLALENVHDPDLRFVKGATLHNLGVIQLWLRQHEAAVKSFQQALVERSKHLPTNHPDIVVSAISQAIACFAFGRLDGAITALEKTLPMIPADHAIRAKVLNNLGVAKHFQGDRKGALQEFTMALEIQRQWLEASVLRDTIVYDTSVTLSNMGKLYAEQSDFDLSIILYEEASALQTSIFKLDHNLVLASLSSLALAKANKGDLENALQILQGCLGSQNTRYGALSAQSMETVGLSGFLYARNGDFNNAVKAIYSVRKWQKANLPENHPALLKSKECMKAIEAKLGTNKEKDKPGTRVTI